MTKGNTPIFIVTAPTLKPNEGFKIVRVGSIFKNISKDGKKYWTLKLDKMYLHVQLNPNRKKKELVVIDESKSSDQ